MESLRNLRLVDVAMSARASAVLVALVMLAGCTGGGLSVLWGNPEVEGPGGVVYEYTVAGSESGKLFAAVLCRVAPGEPPPQFSWGLHEGEEEGDVWFDVDGERVAIDAGFAFFISDRAGKPKPVRLEDTEARRVFARDARPDFAELDALWQGLVDK